MSHFNLGGGDIVHFLIPPAGVPIFERLSSQDILGLYGDFELKEYLGHYKNDLAKHKRDRDETADLSAMCQQFPRHGSMIIHPGLIKMNGIPIFVAHQKPGQFFITFQNCYVMSFRTSLSMDVST